MEKIMSDNLKNEIDSARLKVHTDSYPMSIGELVNLYDDNELAIHPEFQRVYRWSDEQKSRLIESIFLGIPLPSIFVAQREDGVWDVVDGLQRLSTIFSFMGKLKDEDNALLPALKLQATKYLSNLKDKKWDNPEEPENEIHSDIKRLFKREKIDVKIIKRESKDDTKFELFQRLNTGGSKLSDQEVRNCMLLMINRDAFAFIKELAKNKDFIATTPISDKKADEAYWDELIVRYFIQRDHDLELRNKHVDVAPYIDAELLRLFDPSLEANSLFQYEKEKEIFIKTFFALNQALEDNAFKKFNSIKDRHEGAVSVPVFEALALAVSKRVEEDNTPTSEEIIKASKKLSNLKQFKDALVSGTRPINRMSDMSEIAKGLF